MGVVILEDSPWIRKSLMNYQLHRNHTCNEQSVGKTLVRGPYHSILERKGQKHHRSSRGM